MAVRRVIDRLTPGRQQEQEETEPVPVPAMTAAVPAGLRVASDIAWRTVILVIAAAMLVYALGQTSSVVIPVAVALLFTSLLAPLVNWLVQRARMPRYLSAAVALVTGIAVVTGLLAVAGGQMVSGLSQLREQFSAGILQIQDWLANGPLQLGGEQLSQLIEQAGTWLSSNTSSLTSGAMAVGSTATNVLAGLLIALVVTFFFLGDGANIWLWCVRLLPREARCPVHNAFRRGWVTLGSYVRTQITVAAIDAVGIAAGALVLGLPLVVPLGMIVFFASFVPMVGAIVSGALAVVLGLVVKGPVTAFLMLAVVLVVQQLESNVLQPVLMSRSVSLHPLATLLGVSAGSFLLGIVGAVFAVPFLAVTNTVMLYLRGHDQFPVMGLHEPPGCEAWRPAPAAGQGAGQAGAATGDHLDPGAAPDGDRPPAGKAGEPGSGS